MFTWTFPFFPLHLFEYISEPYNEPLTIRLGLQRWNRLIIPRWGRHHLEYLIAENEGMLLQAECKNVRLSEVSSDAQSK